MAKAVIGAAEIGAGIVLLLTAPAALAPFAWGLIMAGAGEELAFVADELQGNPSLTASAKLPSAPREGIYGMVRKGGTFIYQSTTGHQLNEVISWAAHACQSIVALYIDQRKFYYGDDGTLSQRSPYGGGNGDGNTYQDDSGNNYNFSGQTAAWHHCAWQCGSNSWSAGMTATRLQSGDTASTFLPTIIGVPIGGTTYAFGCVQGGTAGSSSSVFASASAVGSLATDGTIVWVNLGPAPGGYWFTQLYNQDTTQWANNCTATGLCCTYFKATYDSAVFAGPPQLRATIEGKNNIYDPRTGTYGYTNNAALCIADLLCDPEFGFGVSYATGIDEDQLIAAANLCDEQVQLASASQPGTVQPWKPWTEYAPGNQFTYGGYTYTVVNAYMSEAYFGESDGPNITQNILGAISEARYTVNGYFDSNQEPGQILASMLMACEGRITRQGGVYKIYPAAWYGTSLTFGENDLSGKVTWMESRKFRDRVNCVRATFVCPQYPYNVSGYSYDYKNENIFAGEWQPTDAPPYAQDYLHGYGSITDPGQGDANLVQDGGIRLYADRRYQFVTSAAQCQRLMKIFLLRNRFQGNGTFPMKLSALEAQCQDVINMNFAYLGMEGAYLEVSKFDWVVEEADGSGGQGARPMRLGAKLQLQLTGPSIYEWSVAEEMTLFDQPSPSLENAFQVSPPTALTAISDLATALQAPDGTVTPRIQLTWTEPDDPFVTSGGSIQIQLTPHGTGAWADVMTLAGTAVIAYLGNVVAGQAYDVRIRAVRGGSPAAYSTWVEVDNIVSGVAVSSFVLTPVAPSGTVTAATISSTQSIINVANFTAEIAGFSIVCLPSPSTLTGEVPQQLYYVYYQDPNFAGGAITPVATTNLADFAGKPGYFFIGSILTPAYVAGSGSGTRYYPSNSANLGQTSVSDPQLAYDGNLGTYAAIFSANNLGGMTGRVYGELLLEDFPAVSSPSGMALFIVAQALSNAGGVPWAITACIGTASKPPGSVGVVNARGAWAASTAYAQWDSFTQGGISYLVLTAYTSGSTFGSTDTANCCVLVASGTGNAAQTTYAVPLPTGTMLSGITVDATANPPSTSGIGVAVDLIEVYCS